MTNEEFINEFKILKHQLVESYFSSNADVSRIKGLKGAGLSEEQITLVRNLSDELLTDALYTILLGLDGCASIGEKQTEFKIEGEDGNILGGGDLESLAWDAFHGPNT
ncbi:hypothetical protein KUV95_17085 [Microbulbifer agarilyticus]|uniref:hypothetical protein n=1 Tax=Microbulbifer agarilyticus TaxID=260552 RepID=UPI001C9733D4|nr:hypothetical protein [Microbulbifer agarilyticus]MBY6213265.1 hypothetical protein [Microbulbifer agarilyticus]